MHVLEEHRPALWLGRMEYKLKGNIIILLSSCSIQADWKDEYGKQKLEYVTLPEKNIVELKKKTTTTVYLSCNQACRLVISADILLDSCWAFVVCHLLSVSYLFCTALQWSTQWSRQALKTARKFKWPSILLWNNIWWSLTGNVCMKPPVMIWCCHLPGLAAGTDGGGGGATAAQMVQMWTAKPPEWIPV